MVIYLLELEALGDELALDTDTSYLEDVSAPKVPTRDPGAESVNAVSFKNCFKSFKKLLTL